MGQPVSKTGTTAPFEYQVYTGQAGAGAARGPPPAAMYINNDFAPSQLGYSSAAPVQPTRQEFYRAQRGAQMPSGRPQPQGQGYYPDDGMDDGGFFMDDDTMSGLSGMGRRPQFDPLSMNPNFTSQGGQGMARDMIDATRQQVRQNINPARAQNYRSRPPPQMPAQPKIMRYRTVVDEPAGYVPPSQTGQGYSTQQVAQQPQSNVTPQQVTLYYDPQTGVIQNPNQATTPQYAVQQPAAPAAQQPMYLSYQQPTQAQPTMAYQQMAPAAGYQQPMAYQQATQQPQMGYQFANGMPQGYMMPQYGMQQQPIVIPAQVISK